MVTYSMRHGRTPYSATYRVNSDPTVPATLDEEGIRKCQAARALVPLGTIVACVTSGFAWTTESARLVLGDRPTSMNTITGLGEIDYGTFEGRPFQDYAIWLSEHGPWARLPGSRESQREAILRMLEALRTALGYPGPRLIVAHGLLVSVVLWAQGGGANGAGSPVFFP